MPNLTDVLPELRRRQLFRALVAAQDELLGVWASREAMSRRFGVPLAVVVNVEQEGQEQE